ncbi:hypothetical protein CEXT_35061 [Caerostris extrusa]|uniref:Uncharacterized protein n=1 Tax=Caerostris extrusa TaxID=172846 RepID=A0AAV4VSM8_CAEEX|nr:hypothetical protein CEXT_35061 [Caerostris extrusa]
MTHSEAKHPSFSTTGTDPPCFTIPVKPLPLRPSSSLHEEQPLSSEEGGGEGGLPHHGLPSRGGLCQHAFCLID